MSNPAPRWELRLANSNTFADICILTQARNRQAQIYLNKPGSFVFDLPLEDEQALLVDPVRTCVKAYRNGELVWSGPVWTVQDSAPDNKTQVSCIGWFELLNHRITLEDLQYVDDAGDIALSIYKTTLDNDTSGTPTIANSTFNNTDITNWTYSGNGHITATYSGWPFGGSATGDLHVNVNPGTLTFYTNTFQGGSLEQDSIYYISFYLDVNNIGDGNNMTVSLINTTNSAVIASKEYVEMESWTYPGLQNIEFRADSDISYANLQLRFVVNATTPYWGGFGGYPTLAIDTITFPKKIYDIPVIPGSVEPTQERTKSYPKYSNVGQEITNLSEIESGFDFEISLETRELNIYSRIGQYIDIHLGYGFGANNIKSLSVTQDGSRMVNGVVAIGATTASPVAEDEAKQAVYGKFMETVSAPNTTEAIILGAYANEEVALRSDPLITYDIVPMPAGPDNVPEPFEDYNIGDIIFFSAKKGRIQIDNQAIRIFGMSISIDDNGVETVSSIQTRADG